jgi:hypothetical protein
MLNDLNGLSDLKINNKQKYTEVSSESQLQLS